MDLPTSDNYTITGGNGFTNKQATLQPSGTATFTVQPNAGLSVGPYNEALSVTGTNGTNATVNLQFNVTAGTGGGGGTHPGVTYYTITATAGDGGSISPSGRVSVASGSDRTFTITADNGYKIADVLVDGESVGAIDNYTFENVRRNHTIDVTFEVVSEEPEQPGIADPDDTGVSDWLNTKDHISYLNGYPDDTFGPSRNMTRAEVAAMFSNLLIDQDVDITTTFSDVSADAWYAEAVNKLASLGMIRGYEDGTFRPEQTITRAEFTAIAMRFTNGGLDGDNIFSDVQEEAWYYETVVGSIQYGWIAGYEDGTFRPENTITRAEVTAIANRMLGREGDSDYIDTNVNALRNFADVAGDHWAYYSIMEATNAHDYNKDAGGENWTAHHA